MENILLYEENSSFPKDNRIIYENTEYRFYRVHNYTELFSNVINIIPNLIILEMCLPIFTGIKILKLIRKKYFPRKIPCIIISGYPIKWEEEFFTQNDVQGYLSKPFSQKKLFTLIKKCLINNESSISPNIC